MLRNYLKIAWRNLVRNKAFSAINILGLALGMASSLLICLWINDELSIGTHYANAPHLYRVMEHEIADGRIVTDEDTPVFSHFWSQVSRCKKPLQWSRKSY